MTMTFFAESLDLTCPDCGKVTLLASEVLAIRQTGLCFDCVPEDGLVGELTSRPARPTPTVPEPSVRQLMKREAEGGHRGGGDETLDEYLGG